MDEIEIKLKDYEIKCKDIEMKTFDNFHQMEVGYCNLINQGNELRKKIIENPSGCDVDSLKVLQNKTTDITKLSNKYKSLLNVIKYTKFLYQKYIEYIPMLLEEKQYDEAISIYNQLFNFTGDYTYKQKIANIHFKINKNPQLAYTIYKDIEPFLSNNADYWWQISDIYKELNDLFNCISSIKNACIIENKTFEGNKNNA